MDNRERYKIKQALEYSFFGHMEELLPPGTGDNTSELKKFYKYLAKKPKGESWERYIKATCNSSSWSAKFSFNNGRIATKVRDLASQFGTLLQRMEDGDATKKVYVLDLLQERSYQKRMR